MATPMTVQQAVFPLPETTAEPIELVYLQACPRKTLPPYPLRYLHTLRSGVRRALGESVPGSPDASVYYQELSGLLGPLRTWSSAHQFPIAVMAPSSRHDAEPYFSAIFPKQQECKDESTGLSKRADFRAGDAKSVSDAIHATSCTLSARTPPFENVLIVDDVLANGSTAAAIVHHLRHRAVISSDAKIVLFVALWMTA
jgi:hypothetical protein